MTHDTREALTGHRPLSRRQAIALGGAGIGSFLSGCSGDGGNGSGDGTATEDGGGTAFTRAIQVDPSLISLFGYADWQQYVDSLLIRRQPGEITEPALVGYRTLEGFRNEPGRDEGRLFESWELNVDHDATASDPQYVEVKLREDATWSDETPITAWDLFATVGVERLEPARNEDGEESFHAASGVVDFRKRWDYLEMPEGRDGKRLRFVSEGEGAGLGPVTESTFVGAWADSDPTFDSPAHVEPISAMAEAVEGNLEAARQNPTDTGAWQTKEEIMTEHVDEDVLEDWRDPDVVVTSGPFRLEEFRGSQEIVFEKNPNYRLADEITVSKLVLDFTAGVDRQKAMLQNGGHDYVSLQGGAVGRRSTLMSENAVENVADQYELVNSPRAGPGVIGLNHSHWAFGDRRVRAALLYAIDSEAVAADVEPFATEPIDRPGADISRSEWAWSEEFVAENFVDYSVDRERADSLMREAGFEKNNRDNWQRDGRELQFEFHTNRGDPSYEISVVDQLDAWGCQIQVQTQDGAAFESDLDDGQLDFYRRGGELNYKLTSLPTYWAVSLLIDATRINRHNIYDRSAAEEAVADYPSSGTLFDLQGERPWERFEGLTIELPPLWEPSGETEPVAMSYEMARSVFGNEPRGQAYWNLAGWATNWFLPALPIYKEKGQHFINTEGFSWPTDSELWSQFGDQIDVSTLMAIGMIDAN